MATEYHTNSLSLFLPFFVCPLFLSHNRASTASQLVVVSVSQSVRSRSRDDVCVVPAIYLDIYFSKKKIKRKRNSAKKQQEPNLQELPIALKVVLPKSVFVAA